MVTSKNVGQARITCENRPGLLPPLSTHALNCRRAQLRTEEGEGLVSRLGRSKEEEDDEIAVCRFPYLSLTGRSSDAEILCG